MQRKNNDAGPRSGGSAAYTRERMKIARLFGANLKMLREVDGKSQDALAIAARLHRSEISLLERGERAPSLLTLLILSDALWVRPDTLLERLPIPKERKPDPGATRRLRDGG